MVFWQKQFEQVLYCALLNKAEKCVRDMKLEQA